MTADILIVDGRSYKFADTICYVEKTRTQCSPSSKWKAGSSSCRTPTARFDPSRHQYAGNGWVRSLQKT